MGGPNKTASGQFQALLDDIEAMRAELRRRRRESPYPWDPAPLDEAGRLLERAAALLPDAPVAPPEPDLTSPAGRALWRTPTDEALLALEKLQAALTTALDRAGIPSEH